MKRSFQKRCCAVGLVMFVACTVPVVQANSCVPPAYEKVAHEYAIPADIFYAISLQESGRYTEDYGFAVWPWALNIDYQTYYPDSADEAIELIEQNLARGSEKIAVGLMQVYWRYHKNRFEKNPRYALDIATNLRLGAIIYKEFLDESGDPWKAVGQYYAGELSNAQLIEEANTYTDAVRDKHKRYVIGGCDETHLADSS